MYFIYNEVSFLKTLFFKAINATYMEVSWEGRYMKRTRNLYNHQIRKQRRIADILKENTLLNACIDNHGDNFAEIKKIRKTLTTCSMTIVGVESEVEGHFADIYAAELYNYVDDQQELKEIEKPRYTHPVSMMRSTGLPRLWWLTP